MSSGSLHRLLPQESAGTAPDHSAALLNCMALPTCCPHHAFTWGKSVSDSSDKQTNKKKDFICNLPPCPVQVFLLAAFHIPPAALTSRSDASPAARAMRNRRTGRAAPTLCSNQTSQLRQPHQGFDPVPCPGSRANQPLLKRQPQE